LQSTLGFGILLNLGVQSENSLKKLNTLSIMINDGVVFAPADKMPDTMKILALGKWVLLKSMV
jgi:hypothetical protein